MTQINREIGSAARLPLSVAVEVVAQGIRIRLGRSLVTLMGVICGIAFLAVVLSGGLVREGVAGEQQARVEASRMLTTLEAESGPVRGRRVAILASTAPSDAAMRLIERCRQAGATIAWFGAGTPPGASAEADLGAALTASHAAILIGPAPADLASAIPAMARPILAALDSSPVSPGARIVSLAWQPRPEDAARHAKVVAEEQARSYWIIGIALAVTAIGIANAMLMSVTERFREIGTMKCLGALSMFIRRIFFLESAFLGLVGGIAGALLGATLTVLGYGFGYGFAMVMQGTNWLHLSGFLALSVLISVFLAVGAAIYPATVASRMRPSAALRSSV